MVVGEKRRLWIPEELAYGGQAGKPAGMLVFDVELLRFQERAKPPAGANGTTRRGSGPPTDAEFDQVGSWPPKSFEAGTGTEHPTLKSQVTVHYNGWTTDGKLFDSSVARGQPETLSLGRVIPGWRQGIQLMVVGEKRRFWIPEELAYQGTKPPFGMLVFDVELISFE